MSFEIYTDRFGDTVEVDSDIVLENLYQEVAFRIGDARNVVLQREEVIRLVNQLAHFVANTKEV